MEDFSVVQFDDPASFLKATKQYDDSFMNYGIGSLCDFLKRAKPEDHLSVILLGIYFKGDLLLTLTKEKPAAPWKICTPCSSQDIIATSLLNMAFQLLCTTLADIVGPATVTQVSGPEIEVNTFLDIWVALLHSRGINAHRGELIASWNISYAIRDSLPSLNSTSDTGIVTLTTLDDVEAVAELYVDFVITSPWPGSITKDEAVAFMARTITSATTWLYRTESGEVAAYAILGRETPRTVSIRNLYVAPHHRRKGIAEAMVRAITRYYLGVRPSAVAGVPDVPPSLGVKEEVNLLVKDPGAERIYRRAGFLFPERTGCEENGGRDPASGRKAWYHAVWQAVSVVSELSH